MKDNAISVRGISKRFGRTVALEKGFSIEVVRGQSLAILGANGAGKTTLMRAVLGLTIPEEGLSASMVSPLQPGIPFRCEVPSRTDIIPRLGHTAADVQTVREGPQRGP